MLKLGTILDFVFPLSCVLCSETGASVCDSCLEVLPRARLGCLRCGRKNPYGLYCPKCRGRFTPDRVLACYKFEGASRELIHSFKYEDITALASPVVIQMAKLVRGDEDYKNFVLVPIPLSRKRRAFRGYNQAELLCRELSEMLGLKWVEILCRTKGRASQVQVGSKAERRRNVKNSFDVAAKLNLPKKVILVDDVITSGATVEEATKVLKRAGAEVVVCLAIALA
ncbi:MAG: ComF family protein [Candidatus Berkelbacteria bacterium]|nr:ComF family protein [Candidatus Berkelbacteria bacterium]